MYMVIVQKLLEQDSSPTYRVRDCIVAKEMADEINKKVRLRKEAATGSKEGSPFLCATCWAPSGPVMLK